MSISSDSDEAFARRLQAQELGIYRNHNGQDAQTPLMVRMPNKLINIM